MNKEIKQLQVGDVVFGKSNYGGYSRYVIERVTAKRAFAKNQGFAREYSGKYVHSYPAPSVWGTVVYQIPDEETALEYEKQIHVATLSAMDWDKKSLDILRSVVRLLNSPTAKATASVGL